MWKDLLASRELAWRLFIRNISARYRQSVLGVFWAFLPPIITGLVFIILQSKSVLNLGETDIPYPVYVLMGVTLWQLFVESLHQPLSSVNSARSILAKINFPREALLVSAFYETLFNFLIKLVVLVGIFLFFKVQITWGVLSATMAVLMLIILGLTIGLFLTPIGMLYTDMASALRVATQLWFFATPVVYPPPQSWPYSLISTLNPVSPLLSSARDLATKGTLADSTQFAVVSVLTLLVLILSWILYRLSMPILIERMSA
jgi:lipopolysaccharide transport system permease protein